MPYRYVDKNLITLNKLNFHSTTTSALKNQQKHHAQLLPVHAVYRLFHCALLLLLIRNFEYSTVLSLPGTVRIRHGILFLPLLYF